MIDTMLSFDPTNDGIPSPNDAPIPLPAEPPNIPSDGRARKALSKPDSQEPATVAPALLCPLCCEYNTHPATQCPAVAAEKARQARAESAGRGIARQMRYDRARFLRCVARVGDSDRHAMAGALASYICGRADLFTVPPISAARILSFWADEHVALAF